MDNGNYLNGEINGNNFVNFLKNLTKFAVMALLISTGFINETNGMRHKITTQCFDIDSKEVCGNVLLYHTGAFYGPIALQSGLGSDSARQLAEKTKRITTVSPLVLSGLDVVLTVGLHELYKLKKVDSGNFYESIYANVDLQDAVKTLENDIWNPSDAAIAIILNSLYDYGMLLNNINWGHVGSAISNQTNKNNWLQILGFLRAKSAPHVSKLLIRAMIRGRGFELHSNALKALTIEIMKLNFADAAEKDISAALSWGRYALHTEAQVEALRARNISVVSRTLNIQTNKLMSIDLGSKRIELMGDCYSLYNPCRSCQGLNWVILYRGNQVNHFLFCLSDNSFGGARQNWPVNFTPF